MRNMIALAVAGLVASLATPSAANEVCANGSCAWAVCVQPKTCEISYDQKTCLDWYDHDYTTPLGYFPSGKEIDWGFEQQTTCQKRQDAQSHRLIAAIRDQDVRNCVEHPIFTFFQPPSWLQVTNTKASIAYCTKRIANDRAVDTAIGSLPGYDLQTCVRNSLGWRGFSGNSLFSDDLRGVQKAAATCQTELGFEARDRLNKAIIWAAIVLSGMIFFGLLVAARKHIFGGLYRLFIGSIAAGIRADRARKRFVSNAVMEAELLNVFQRSRRSGSKRLRRHGGDRP